MNTKIKGAICLGLASAISFAIAASFKSPSIWKGASEEVRKNLFFFACIIGGVLAIIALVVVAWFLFVKPLPSTVTFWAEKEIDVDDDKKDWEHHASYP